MKKLGINSIIEKLQGVKRTMSVINTILKQLLLFILTSMFFIFIIFMPRDVEYEVGQGGMFLGAEYNYSFDKHMENIKGFFTYITESEELGEIRAGEPLMVTVFKTIKKSMLIVFPALIIAFFLGIAKGIYDFKSERKKTQFLGKGSTWFFLSVPDLFLIIFIQLSLMVLYDHGLFFHVDLYGSDTIDNFIVCTLFLAIYPLFYIANITYLSLKDEDGMDYIRTAKAKGTKELRILYVHVLKNCWGRILTHTNTITLYVLSNLFIVEKLTNFRGAGFEFFQSIAPSTQFFVGMDFGISYVAAFAYATFFTLVIFISNLISKLFKVYLSPTGVEGRQ